MDGPVIIITSECDFPFSTLQQQHKKKAKKKIDVIAWKLIAEEWCV